jgi:hypothetical protein
VPVTIHRRHSSLWVLALAALLLAAPAVAQPDARGVYERACATCHSSDGSGAAAAASEYPLVPVDFRDCRFASREPDADWLAVIHDGGPARGFNRLMPAFGDALTREDINAGLAHLRSFCKDPNWPRGELNLPRPLVTEKAFPEDEAVITVIASHDAVTNKMVYERRIGARTQFELVVPLAFSEQTPGEWTGGVGDVAVAVKRALFHSLRHGSIFSGSLEVVTPTGSTERGIGGGTTVLEPFVAFGQILPRDGFIQLQTGGEFPLQGDHANEAFVRTTLGRSFTQGAFGRSWSPMVEFLAARELTSGEKTKWDVVPQMQVTLSTRQHIMINAGVRIPVNEREGRSTQTMVYLLWDWFDGGFLEGW